MTDVLPCPTVLADDGLVLADLLTDLRETTQRLVARLVAGDDLDAFLLAAAAVQIAEDELQRDTWALRRGARYASARRTPRAVPGALSRAATAAEWIRARRLATHRAARWTAQAADLRDGLARRVIAALDQPPEPRRADRLAAELAVARRLFTRLPALDARLCAGVLRLPSCFRSFDQHPRDVLTMAHRYADRHPDRDAPVLVLGVRTSGSYLAPLTAAALRAMGYAEVHAETARPEFPLRDPVRHLVRSVTHRGGRVVIVDDPPSTGSAIRAVARSAARNGTGASAVTLLLPLFGADLPDSLRPYDAVLLRYEDWSIHPRLGLEALRPMLAELLGDNGIVLHDRPDPAPPAERGHRRVIVEAELSDGSRREIVASGAGLGYLGRHALAVARALPAALPATYGFRDGIMFRDWLPAEWRLRTVRPADVPAIAGYVRSRAIALPVHADRSVALAGRQPVWEVASRVLEPGYGRLGVLLRPVLIDRLVRRLCAVDRPSVVDGATGAAHWFRDGATLRKVDADVRDFANTDLSCYDPVFDLAGVDPGGADPEVTAALRAALPGDPERFLLYELVHLWDRSRDGHQISRAAARAVQRYVAGAVLAGLRTDPDGPLCALDVDGALESDALGFPILTPTAAMALRALIAHGFRPVPVTGRSLGEVRDRCVHYGLVGGVAEYGAVVYDHRLGVVRELTSAADRELVGDLRERLRRLPGVFVDDDYSRVVRAFRLTADGKPLRLRSAVAAEAMAAVDPDGTRLRVVRGDGQTDFVPASVDKGTGLAALAQLLGTPPVNSVPGKDFPAVEIPAARNGHVADPASIAFAVGDAEPDLGMFGLAGLACAPANADQAVRSAGIPVGHRAFGAGFADAVARLIGHRPGGCAVCAPPAGTTRQRTLFVLLDAQRGGARGLPVSILRGLRELARRSR